MTLNSTNIESADPKLEKYVSRLKEPAKRAKQVLKDALQKSVKRFQDQAEKSASDKEKYLFLKKTKRISKDLDVLKVLSEDDIIRYALLMLNKIMPIASNPRVPREERMKARVAAHKPLSAHLARLKNKLGKVQEETVSESENEQDNNSTLNKITFNKTVVLMRKDVRRSKVHIIHKLTRIIQKLRMSKGNKEKVAKFQRKAERLHKKVIHIKELQEDEISKFALSTTQNLSLLATDIKAPTKSQALATIAIHEFVAAHVRDFKTKNPDWEKIVPNFLKKKSKKRKLNLDTKDKKTSSEMSQANVESDSSQSERVNNSSESEKDEESDNSESEVEEERGVEVSEVDEFEVEDNRTSQNKGDEDDSEFDNGVLNSRVNDGRSVKNTRDKNSKKIKISTEDSKIIQKISKECNKKTTANKNITKTREILKKTSLSPPYVEAKPVKDKPKVIDPFFVTTTNEEYVTSQVPVSSENNLSSRKIEHFEPNKSGSFINCDYKNKWERTGNERKYGKFNRFQDSAPNKNQSSGSFDKYSAEPKMDKLVFGNRKERRKALHQPQVVEKVEKLHPSWEAKKKQSTIIPFQGKKVMFD